MVLLYQAFDMTPLLIRAFIILTSCTSAICMSTYAGCFTSPTGLEYNARSVFQSVGLCSRQCSSSNRLVMGVTNRTDCLCSDVAPPPSSMVEESWCDSPCPGYAVDTCGGKGFFSVYLLAEPNSPERRPNERSTQSAEPAGTGVSLPQASIVHSQVPSADTSEL
ncbi:hypothetical protein F4677DRAFT_21893 [Hypoxylon crocopeplum]|nr:hypothetical protein F4677DRAFT_21893 [Hypoxylon crocopeplum]